MGAGTVFFAILRKFCILFLIMYFVTLFEVPKRSSLNKEPQYTVNP